MANFGWYATETTVRCTNWTARSFRYNPEQKDGATPSDILYNPLSKSLWVTQRFNNELWEIDPGTRKVKTK